MTWSEAVNTEVQEYSISAVPTEVTLSKGTPEGPLNKPPRIRYARKKRSEVTEVRFYTFNSNGKGQLDDFLDRFRPSEDAPPVYPYESLPMAVALQEHWQRNPVDYPSFVERAQRRRWKICGSPAGSGPKGGASAGTAIAVATGACPVAALPGLPGVDISPEDRPGRITAVFIQHGALPRGGILYISVYAYTGEPLDSEANLQLLYKVAEATISYGGPFIIAGDFQNTPTEVLHSPWPRVLGTETVAPSMPTCNSARVIDFFLVDKRIGHLINSAEADGDWLPRAHRPVMLRLKVDRTPIYQTVRVSPAKFPRTDPPCPRRPLPEAVSTYEVRAQAGLAELWDVVSEGIEKELCYAYGKFACLRGSNVQADEPRPRRSYLGRGKDFATKRTEVLPVVYSSYGVVPHRDRALLALATALDQYVTILRSLSSEDTRGKRAAEAHWRMQLTRPTHWVQLAFTLYTDLAEAVDSMLSGPVHWLNNAIKASRTAANLRKMLSENAKERNKDKTAHFRGWVEQQLATGAAALHRICKPQVVEILTAVPLKDGLAADPDTILHQEFAKWAPIWERHLGVTAPWREWSEPVDPLPDITPEELRAAAMSFKCRTGYVGFHPRWFAHVSDRGLQRVADLLHQCEREGRWPQQLCHSELRLIPKREGGTRPIGLVDGLCRLWERVRRPITQRWRAERATIYDFSSKGRKSSQAVWLQSLYDEAAAQLGHHSATILLDLMKAFESIPLATVWEKGLEMGYPPYLLRLSLEVCAFGRHLVYSGSISEGILTLSAILAGTSAATDLLFIAMHETCELILDLQPSAVLSLVVDDLAIQVQGPTPTAAEASLLTLTDFALCQLERLGAIVSVGEHWSPGGKTVVTASKPTEAMNRGLRARGIQMKRAVRHLGIDYAPAGLTSRPVRKARVKAVAHRAARLRRLNPGPRAAARVTRTAFIPAMAYGSAVVHLTDAEIKTMNSIAHAAMGPAAGRSAYARFTLTGGLPLADAAVAPIRDLAEAIFSKAAPDSVIQAAWETALEPCHTAVPIGPVGSARAAAARLGWVFTDTNLVREPSGYIFNLAEDAPHQVYKAALQAFRRWSAANSSLAAEIKGTPNLEPLAAVIRAKSTPWPIKKSLQTLGECGWPSQASYHTAGRSSSAACALCGHPWGSFYHRCRVCPHTKWMRESRWGKEAKLDQAGQGEAEELAEPLFRRGIPEDDPAADMCKPPELVCKALAADGTQAESVPEGFRSAGTDGSLIDPKPARAARAGWSVVLRTAEGMPAEAAYGSCPDRCPSVPRSEAWGVLMALRISRGPLEVRTDCKNVVDQYARGRKYCTDPKRPLADLWKAIFQLLDDYELQESDLKLKWIKGHTSEADVDKGTISAEDRALNLRTDELAKLGAGLSRELSPNEMLVREHNDAVCFYRAISQFCGDNWPEDYHEPEAKPVRAVKERLLLVHPTRPHEPWLRRSGHVSCPWCNKAAAADKAKNFARAKCSAFTIDPELSLVKLAEARRCSLLLDGATKLQVSTGKFSKKTLDTEAADKLATLRAEQLASHHAVSFNILRFIDLRASQLPTWTDTKIWINKPQHAMYRCRGRQKPHCCIKNIASHPAYRDGPDVIMWENNAEAIALTFVSRAEAQHFIDILGSVPKLFPNMPRPVNKRIQDLQALVGYHQLRNVRARVQFEPAAPQEDPTPPSEEAVLPAAALPISDSEDEWDTLLAQAEVPASSSGSRRPVETLSEDLPAPKRYKERSEGIAYDLLPDFRNWVDPMDWASADPEDRARRHAFDPDIIDEDGDWIVGPAGSEVPPAWTPAAPVPAEAPEAASAPATAAIDLTESFIDLTAEHSDVETPAEAHTRALSELDVVRPGVAPSDFAAAGWMAGAFGRGWRAAFHPTHDLRLSVPVVFCHLCGHSCRPRGRPGLREPCPGEPAATSNYVFRRRRLREGRAPYGESAALCPPVVLRR